MSDVTKFAKSVNLDADKLLGDWIVCIPGFTLQKYRQLQRSRLSIFSINCFGGQLHHTFGLQFRSPFINLFAGAESYLKLLRYPRIYMEETPILKKFKLNEAEQYEYPVVTFGNIDLHMLHYKSFEDAVTKWNERKQRINWYNIFVEMHTDKLEFMEKFDELPYGKKVCFVPFKSDLDSAFYINPKFNNERPFTETVFDLSQGRIFYYDPFDMLLYGKKTPLIEM